MKNNKHKNVILSVCVAIFLFSCNKKSDSCIPENLKSDFKILSTKKIPNYIDSITKDGWLLEFEKEIKEEQPYIDYSDTSLEYLLVPSLNIPVKNIADFESNILNYLGRGSLELNNSEFLVFNNDTLLLKFLIIEGVSQVFDGVTRLNFSKILNQTNIKVFNTSEIYFKIAITSNRSSFHIPGIIIKQGNTYNVMNSKGIILPIQNLHSLLFKNKEGMDRHIKRIINENSN